MSHSIITSRSLVSKPLNPATKFSTINNSKKSRKNLEATILNIPCNTILYKSLYVCRRPSCLTLTKEFSRTQEGIKALMLVDLLGVDINKALTKNPSLKSTSAEQIYNVLNFFQEMGFMRQDLARIFDMCPTLLNSNVDNDLKPVLDFLLHEVGLPLQDVIRVVNRIPILLAFSVEERINPSFQFLQRLGFKPQSFSDSSNIALLAFSVERSFVPKLEYLQSLGLSHDETVLMVLRAPEIFSFSIENNMKPKYEYLVDVMGRGATELIRFPQYFAFSMKRIMLRHTMTVESKTSLSLSTMLRPKFKVFVERLRKEERTKRVKAVNCEQKHDQRSSIVIESNEISSCNHS